MEKPDILVTLKGGRKREMTLVFQSPTYIVAINSRTGKEITLNREWIDSIKPINS